MCQSNFWSAIVVGDSVVALHAGGSGEYFETGLSFQVDDIQAACEEIIAGGGVVLKTPGEPIKLADLLDTEGNGFMVTQHIT